MRFTERPICGKIINSSKDGKILHFVMDNGDHLVINREEPQFCHILQDEVAQVNDEFCFIGHEDGKIRSVFKRENYQDGFK